MDPKAVVFGTGFRRHLRGPHCAVYSYSKGLRELWNDERHWESAVLYTFIDEFDGNTFVSQARGASVEQAVVSWMNSETRQPPPKPGQEINPVEISGTEGVWCVDYHDTASIFHIVHVVLTEERSENR